MSRSNIFRMRPNSAPLSSSVPDAGGDRDGGGMEDSPTEIGSLSSIELTETFATNKSSFVGDGVDDYHHEQNHHHHHHHYRRRRRPSLPQLFSCFTPNRNNHHQQQQQQIRHNHHHQPLERNNSHNHTPEKNYHQTTSESLADMMMDSATAATTTVGYQTPPPGDSSVYSTLTGASTLTRMNNGRMMINNDGDPESSDPEDEDDMCVTTITGSGGILPINGDKSIKSGDSGSRFTPRPTKVMVSRIRKIIVKPKSFSSEVRAIRDVQSFLNNPNVKFDIDGDAVEDVIERMLSTLTDLDDSLKMEACSSLYGAKNAYQLTDFLQGIYLTEDGEYLNDPTWLCTFASVDNLPARRIVIARLNNPTNFGVTLTEIQLIILVLVPSREKESKSAFEIARTFATLLSDAGLRFELMRAHNEQQFIQSIKEHVTVLKRRHSSKTPKLVTIDQLENGLSGGSRKMSEITKPSWIMGRGLINDFRRRIRHYPSDFIDGIRGKNTLSKVSAAVLSIFFACILPPIAFGVVNQHNTHGLIGPKEGLIGQAIGGLFFAFFCGQPLVIIATTAPLTLYVAIVYQQSQEYQVDFLDMFAAVGCFCALYLCLYAVLNVSNLTAYLTRSIEEIFATFVFVAFTATAFGECRESFRRHYCFDNTCNTNLTSILNGTGESIIDNNPIIDSNHDCLPAKAILFLFLMLGTVSMAVLLYNFSFTPYLSSFLRGTLSDYALPLSVVTFSFIGSVLFRDVHTDSFVIKPDFQWRIATFRSLTPGALALSALLGLFLSMLFFIAQSVCASIVSTPTNHLKKGTAFHWDLLVLGLINAVLSMLGLPWIYGVLPHSPLHARLLADVVPATSSQHTTAKPYVVVRVRETRITGILVHVMIGTVVMVVPNILSHIPVAVLCGLFLYCAISTLRNNSIAERVVLFLTEQHSYPPTSYLRHVPQRTVHCFTACQLGFLALISFVGFCPWKTFRLFFPLVIALMIPIRQKILPKYFKEKHLKIIDSKHY